MKKLIIYYIFLISIFSSLKSEDLKVSFGAYLDTYIATDNDNKTKPWDDPNSQEKYSSRKLTYVDYKKNQFDLNIAQISATFDYKDYARGKVTFQNGTLANTAFYGSNLQEAYCGFKLFDGFWVDAGYFLTHIGGEALLPKDNWLTSHSMVTYFEPFYHSGIKATYTTGNLITSVHILNTNGTYEENNDNKSIGIYLAYNINENSSISYASIFGNEEYGSPNNAKNHMLHNICANYNFNENFETKAQFDFASKENVKLENNKLNTGNFIGASLQARYTFTPKFKSTVRIGWFNDEDLVYSTGLSGIDLTLGLEFKPINNSYFRIEGNYLNLNNGTNDAGKIFIDKDKKPTNSRMSILFNAGIYLN